MTPLTLPQARIPLGWARINGQRVPVEIDIEWMRAFLQLVQRSGGVPGVDLTELTSQIEGLESLNLLPSPGAVPAPQDLDAMDGARLHSLEAEVHKLRTQIQGLQQGIHP